MTPAPRNAVLAVGAIVLLAASLRVAVASLSPVIEFVQADIGVSSTVVGLIGAAPPVSFAVFGILTPALARRVPLEWIAVVTAAVAASGLAARAFVGDAAGLLIATLVAFAAIGVGNVILPALVKKYFPARIGLMTTVYISAMCLATIAPPFAAVPIAMESGWRFSLGIWAVVGAVAVVPWVALIASERRRTGEGAALEEANPAVLGRVLSLPRTWALIVGFMVTAATAYSMFAWMPAMLREQAGVDAETAGILLGIFAGMGLPFSLLAPWLVARFRIVKTLFVVAVVPGLVGLAGLIWAPAAAPWVWVLLLTLPTMLFPVMLVLVGLLTRAHPTTVALSGAVQSFGYGLAAIFPVAVGALHDATGDWSASLVLLAVMIAAGLPAAIVIVRPGTIEDDWERRHGPW